MDASPVVHKTVSLPSETDRLKGRWDRLRTQNVDYVDSHVARIKTSGSKSEIRKSILVIVSNQSAFVFTLATEDQYCLTFKFTTTHTAAPWLESGFSYLCEPSDFLAGYAETVIAGYVHGWAINLLTTDPPQLGLWVGSLLHDAAATGHFRPDISPMNPGAASHGFHLRLPNTPTAARSEIQIRTLDYNYTLAWARQRQDEALWQQKSWTSAKQRSGHGLAFELKRSIDSGIHPCRPPFRINHISLDICNAEAAESFLRVPINKDCSFVHAEQLSISLPWSLPRSVRLAFVEAIDRLVLLRGHARVTELRFERKSKQLDQAQVCLDAAPFQIAIPLNSDEFERWFWWSTLTAIKSAIRTDNIQSILFDDQISGLTRLIDTSTLIIVTDTRDLKAADTLASRAAFPFSSRVLTLSASDYGYSVHKGTDTLRNAHYRSSLGRYYYLNSLFHELLSQSGAFVTTKSNTLEESANLLIAVRADSACAPFILEALFNLSREKLDLSGSNDYAFICLPYNVSGCTPGLAPTRCKSLEWIGQGSSENTDQTISSHEWDS